MEYSLDMPMKGEETERDSNDNLRLLFDVKIKMEQEINDDRDWCVTNFEGNSLLEPLFFKHFTEIQGPQCGFCGRYFPDRNTIFRHNLSHLQVTIINPVAFQCDLCATYFINKRSMERHISTHNRSRTKNLTYRPKTNRTGQDLKKKSEHVKYDRLKDGMTNLLPYKPKAFKAESKDCLDSNKTHLCNVCLKMFTYKNWHAHMQDVHGVGKFPCGICGVIFKCERYLKRHLSNIHIKKALVKTSIKCDQVKTSINCDQCDAVLQSSNALTTHKRNVHSDNKHVCYICKSMLKCKSYLLAHMRRVHCSDGKKHECDCGKSFKSHRYLMVHKRYAHSKKGRKVDIKTENMLE